MGPAFASSAASEQFLVSHQHRDQSVIEKMLLSAHEFEVEARPFS